MRRPVRSGAGDGSIGSGGGDVAASATSVGTGPGGRDRDRGVLPLRRLHELYRDEHVPLFAAGHAHAHGVPVAEDVVSMTCRVHERLVENADRRADTDVLAERAA